ncbi:MAG: HYR-like domain-containing protein, partial [Planctomycetota bacterium]
DNCDTEVPVVFEEESTGTCPDSQVITRTWTATDDCGNSVTHTQTLTVVDTVAPVLSEQPSDATVECDAVPAAIQVTATDNCDNEVPVSFDEQTTETDSVIITRTWSATDDCGNSVTHTQTLTVVDTTAPILTIPEDIVFECGADEISPANYGEASAEDNCDPNPQITMALQKSEGACENTVVMNRVFTATDASGNSSTGTQIITIGDSTPPTIDVSIEHRSFKNRGYLWPPEHKIDDIQLTITATDDCDAPEQLQIEVKVFADEDEMADTGSGTTSPDAKFEPLRLRSERMGATEGGDGRVYMVVVLVTDCSGNMGHMCVTATVPIDQKQYDIDNVLAQAAEAEAACDQFVDYALGELVDVPLGYYVVGVGEEIGNKQ